MQVLRPHGVAPWCDCSVLENRLQNVVALLIAPKLQLAYDTIDCYTGRMSPGPAVPGFKRARSSAGVNGHSSIDSSAGVLSYTPADDLALWFSIEAEGQILTSVVAIRFD